MKLIKELKSNTQTMKSLQIWTLIKCPSYHPINSVKA